MLPKYISILQDFVAHFLFIQIPIKQGATEVMLVTVSALVYYLSNIMWVSMVGLEEKSILLHPHFTLRSRIQFSARGDFKNNLQFISPQTTYDSSTCWGLMCHAKRAQM